MVKRISTFSWVTRQEVLSRTYCPGLSTEILPLPPIPRLPLATAQMAVAYFQFHWKFQIGPKFFPAFNKGELAALYCFVFLYIACRGGVKWSLDKKDR
jgi:hypothetical protein